MVFSVPVLNDGPVWNLGDIAKHKRIAKYILHIIIYAHHASLVIECPNPQQ